MVRNCKIVGQISIFFSVGISLQNFTMKEKTGNLGVHVESTVETCYFCYYDYDKLPLFRQKKLFGNDHGKDYSNAIKLLTTTTCTLGGLHVTKDTV